MNPSTADIVAAIEATDAPEVVVLPNNSNVILSAEQAAEHAAKPVAGRPHALDPGRDRGAGRLRRHAERGRERSGDGGGGRSRRDRGGHDRRRATSQLTASPFARATSSALSEGEPVARRRRLRARSAALAVVERLLAEPRGVLTILTGEDAPELNGLLERIAERAPGPRGRGPGRRPAALPPAALGRVDLELAPIRVVLSRTTTSSARRSSCCSSCAATSRSSARSARRRAGGASSAGSTSRTCSCSTTGCRASTASRSTRLVREECPEVAVVVSDRRRAGARDRGAARGRRGRLHRQGRAARRDHRGDPPGGGRGDGLMQLTAENTAIVLDSTADFPDGPQQLPELAGRAAVRPLRRSRASATTRSSARTSSTSGSAGPAASPTTSQPTPGDFLAPTRSSAATTRILSLHIPAKLSGTVESARRAAEELGDGRVRAIDTRQRLGRPGAARARRRSGGSSAGTTDEEVDALVERFRRESRVIFTVDTLEYLAKGGRIGKAAAMAGTLLNIKPILGIEDGEVVPLKRVRGAHKAFLEFERAFESGSSDGPSLRVGIAHADAPERLQALRELSARLRPQARDRGRDDARRGRRDARRARARSASSGSTTPTEGARYRRAMRAFAGADPPDRVASPARRGPAGAAGARARHAARGRAEDRDPPAQARPRVDPRPAGAPAARLPARGRREPDRPTSSASRRR